MILQYKLVMLPKKKINTKNKNSEGKFEFTRATAR